MCRDESTLRGKAERGKGVVIDPRRTLTAEKADIDQARPAPTPPCTGHCPRIIERVMTDREFIRKHVAGFDEFKASLQMTPDKAQEITGVPADEIIELAVAAAGAGRLTIIAGYGLQRYTNGGQTIRSLLTITVITGMIGKPCVRIHFASLQS
jgi:anaerobic selenocysteine-containing dehydrogenase